MNIPIPPPFAPGVSWDPLAAGPSNAAILAVAQGITNNARPRQVGVYGNASQMNAIGLPAPSTFGAIAGTVTFVFTDSIYWSFLDGGGVGNSAGIAIDQIFALQFQPIHFECQIRTSSLNQSEYRLWVGLQTLGTAINSDTLGLGIAFRYRHPVAAGPDSGNWILCVNDGATQTEFTASPALGGVPGSHAYRFTIDVDATTIRWASFDLTAGTSVSGSFAIPAGFTRTTRLFGVANMVDIAGAVKEFHVAKFEASLM